MPPWPPWGWSPSASACHQGCPFPDPDHLSLQDLFKMAVFVLTPVWCGACCWWCLALPEWLDPPAAVSLAAGLLGPTSDWRLWFESASDGHGQGNSAKSRKSRKNTTNIHRKWYVMLKHYRKVFCKICWAKIQGVRKFQPSRRIISIFKVIYKRVCITLEHTSARQG